MGVTDDVVVAGDSGSAPEPGEGDESLLSVHGGLYGTRPICGELVLPVLAGHLLPVVAAGVVLMSLSGPLNCC